MREGTTRGSDTDLTRTVGGGAGSVVIVGGGDCCTRSGTTEAVGADVGSRDRSRQRRERGGNEVTARPGASPVVLVRVRMHGVCENVTGAGETGGHMVVGGEGVPDNARGRSFGDEHGSLPRAACSAMV